jgi:hypothetical protein
LNQQAGCFVVEGIFQKQKPADLQAFENDYVILLLWALAARDFFLHVLQKLLNFRWHTVIGCLSRRLGNIVTGSGIIIDWSISTNLIVSHNLASPTLPTVNHTF